MLPSSLPDEGLLQDLTSHEFGAFELFDDPPAREWSSLTGTSSETIWGLKIGVCALLGCVTLAATVLWISGIEEHGFHTVSQFPQLGEPAQPSPVYDPGPKPSVSSLAATTREPAGADMQSTRHALPAIEELAVVTTTMTGTVSIAATHGTGAAVAAAATSTLAANTTTVWHSTTLTTTIASCRFSQLDRYPQCKAATAEVHDLRCMGWPLEHKDAAPQISQAVYINLDRDAKRRKWMEAHLGAVHENLTESARLQGIRRNFSFQRIAALDIHQASQDPRFERIRRRGFSKVPYPVVDGKWSIAGCTFSHLTALWQLREHAADLVALHQVWLILEDDATVEPGIEDAWLRLWPWLPQEWDIVRLGWFGGSDCFARVNDHIDVALWRDPAPMGPCYYCGSHAYVVNPASIHRVIQRLEDSRIMHVDCLLGAQTPPLEDPESLPPLRVFAPRPSISVPNYKFPSDRIDG